MKFSVSLEQRDFFRKTGFIHFVDLLNTSELAILNSGIEESLAVIRKKISQREPASLGRDLWRLNEGIKKIVFSKRLIDLAYELIQKKPLRIAFDELLPEKSLYSRHEINDFHYSDTASFQEHSCISGLQGHFLLCIKRFPDTVPAGDSNPLFALEEGSGFFIAPEAVFPFLSATPSTTMRFFLIGYCDKFSQYLHEERDPHCHFLKSLGYVFGDTLNDRLHPIILR